MNFIQTIIKKVQGIDQKYINSGLIILIIYLGIYLKFDFQRIAVLVFLVWVILYQVTSRTLAELTVFSLILIPGFIITGQDALADKVGTISYGLMFLTTCVIISEHYQLRNTRKKSQIVKKAQSRARK